MCKLMGCIMFANAEGFDKPLARAERQMTMFTNKQIRLSRDINRLHRRIAKSLARKGASR